MASGLLLALAAACGDGAATRDTGAEAGSATIGRRVFLLNRDRDEILVDGAAGADFTNLRGELPWITEVRCGERTRRALVQLPGSEVAFPGALPHAGALEFGVAFRQAAPDGGPTFRLAVLARDRAGALRELWTQTARAPTEDADRSWSAERVELSELPAGDLLLRLSVEPGATPTPALPVWGDPVLRGPGRPAAPARDGARGVVVFLVDTLRADRVGAYGYPRPTTPRLDALAAEGLLFEHAWAASSWTKASVASLFTSRLPSRHGAEDYPHRLRESETTIAELFRRAGWATGAVGANLWIFYPHFHFGGGFDDFLQTFEAVGLGGPAGDAVVDEAIDWLERHYAEPFFLYVHLMDPHSPYRPPGGPGAFLDAPYDGSITGETSGPGAFTERAPDELDADDRRYLDALYDAEIAFADAQMGRLVDALRDLGIWEETAFVFLSDHGEEFGEHGGWEHSTSLFEEQLRVPLVLVPPRSAGLEPARVAEPVGLVDVAPALLELAGVPSAGSPFAERGRGLLDAVRAEGGPPRPVLSELHLQDQRLVAARLGPLKLIADAEAEPRERWYRLDEDPAERAPGPAPDGSDAVRLRARVDEVLARAGEDGVHLELWGGGRVSGVRGTVRSDVPLADVNPRETEYRIEGEAFAGDQAYFADAERRVVAFELRVGPGDERDFVTFRAPAGARLSLETAFLGERPDVVVGSGDTPRTAQPVEVSLGDATLTVAAPPAPPADASGPLLRLYVVQREAAELDAEQRERVRALGYGDD